MITHLDFEKPIAELEGKILELRKLADAGNADITDELQKLESKAEQLLRSTYGKLTPWQKTLVARHPERPHFSDYAAALVDDFQPLAGDRSFADDRAILGGIGRFRGRSIMLIGHEKGRGTEGRVKHNFGMAKPEGYRKAARLMRLADRFRLPVVTLVDTSGAYPGVGAEERGQAEAIAHCIDVCVDIRVPLVAAVIGEGGSGGAVALASGNRVVMLEHAIYSVISPEGCAAILWNAAEKAQDAADALKLTAQDLFRLKVIDQVIAEPVGGAHRNAAAAIEAVSDAIDQQLRGLSVLEPGVLREGRRRKFLDMGKAGL